MQSWFMGLPFPETRIAFANFLRRCSLPILLLLRRPGSCLVRSRRFLPCRGLRLLLELPLRLLVEGGTRLGFRPGSPGTLVAPRPLPCLSASALASSSAARRTAFEFR